METMMNTQATAPVTGNVVRNTSFKSEGDWLNRLIAENCVETGVGAVEAVAEVKDEKGKVTTKGVRGKKGKDVVDVDALKKLAAENSLVVKTYPNAGMYRMNIGNMLRAAARKRHGLNVGGKWVDAPKDFKVNDAKTENPDGTKIAVEKPKKADAKDQGEA